MLNTIFKLFIYTLLAGFLVTSCAKVNVPAIKQAGKIALVSVIAPEEVNTNEVSGGSILALAVAAVKSDTTKLGPSMLMVKNEILQESGTIFKVKIAPESAVINRKEYKSIDDENWGGKVAPKGYKQIYPGEKEKILQAIKGLDGVGAALVVDMESKLVKGGGSLTGATMSLVETKMVFHMYDTKGEEILMQGAIRSSDKSVSSLGGIFDGDELRAAVKSSVKNVLAYVKEMIAEKFAEAEKK